MKYLIPLTLLLVSLFACNESDDPVIEDPNDDLPNNPSDSTGAGEPTTTNLRTFVFGHSLIVHTPPLYPTPSDETTVPHWMHFLSQEAGYQYAVSGQYGFLPQHDDLPPFAQWGFQNAQPAWDSDLETFAEAEFNSVLLTAGNFVQWQPATENYYGVEPETSPVQATVDIFSWVLEQDENITLYIYENWPDMAPYTDNFPPTSQEFTEYHEYTLGEFHDWWIDYHDAVIDEMPNADIKMIPVGPIISKMLTDPELGLSTLTADELYEDADPHGRPSIYFLASLITYSAMYGVEPPADFAIPDLVHETIIANYDDINAFIWNELESFNFDTDESRVF